MKLTRPIYRRQRLLLTVKLLFVENTNSSTCSLRKQTYVKHPESIYSLKMVLFNSRSIVNKINQRRHCILRRHQMILCLLTKPGLIQI